MTTYIYETIPQKPGEQPRRFEVQQAMTEPPLARDPATGAPVRRVIAGGFGFIAQKAAAPKAHSCGAGCGCHGTN